MTTHTPSEHLPTADPAADPPGRVLMVVLPNHVVQRLLVAIVVVTFCGMFLALEAAFARWVPWVTTGGMGALVTMSGFTTRLPSFAVSARWGSVSRARLSSLPSRRRSSRLHSTSFGRKLRHPIGTSNAQASWQGLELVAAAA